ncbi:SMP-30/gluconolactonase/LRE family protein [Collimonas humicola]|uniref:SMP-30/gluconolactonase/LRE family protein n=1 Tax=Collimonas humicola TaxID=2825886 RepID=UPI001B8CC138|nr:SMP-30/gluconolactonase/LRE family protein [Collimonas humicola]
MNQIAAAYDVPMQLGECPLWHAAEASLYWVDISSMQVHRLHPADGKHAMWQLDAEPGCIGLRAGGGLVVAMRTGVAYLDTDSGALTHIADAPYDMVTARFNDGRCDAAGRFWAGTIYEPRDHAGAQLYAIEKGVVRAAGNPVTVSNGLGFSGDSLTLYHSDTTAHRITSYEFDLASGKIGAGRVLRQFAMDKNAPDYGGRPDGAAVDSEDAYWCAMYEGGRLLRLSPAGEVLQEVIVPVRCPTMMAFGGPDLRTLYITSVREKRSAAELEKYPLSGCVLALRVDVPGRAEPSYVA